MDPSSLGILPGTTGYVDPTSAWPIAGSTGIAAGTATGQQGITPLVGSGDATVSDAINDVWEWVNTPFSTPISAITIFGYVGAIIVAIIAWNLILYHIRIAAETI